MAEFTIVGGGLAGCVLGWSLSKRGCDFKIIDRFEKNQVVSLIDGQLKTNWKPIKRIEFNLDEKCQTKF